MNTTSYATPNANRDKKTTLLQANASLKLRKDPSTTSNSSAPSRKPCSIPSKFEPKKSMGKKEKNAFGGRTERFTTKSTSQPGPGYYHKPLSYVKSAETNGSVSARGYTSMISKSSRFNIYENIKSLNDAMLPGPASYNVVNVQGTGLAEKDKNQFPQSMFAKPRRYRDDKVEVRDAEPGPGAYELNPTLIADVINRKQGSSFFKDGSKRFRRQKPQTDHAPGSYNVGSAMDAMDDYGMKDTGASFRSKSNRGEFFVKNRACPGPGDYKPEKSDNILLKTSDLTHQNPAFCKSSCDRFGNFEGNTQKGGDPSPGPGWYEQGDAQTINQEGASSAFRSGSQRLGGGLKKDRYKPPGPAYYNAKPLPTKKSFHFNLEQKWVG